MWVSRDATGLSQCDECDKDTVEHIEIEIRVRYALGVKNFYGGN